MGLSEKIWDTLTTVIKMNDKVENMSQTIKTQQTRIEDLTMRVVRLETALEISMASHGRNSVKRINKQT